MHQVVYQDQNAIEIGMDGRLTRQEFGEALHQLESLRTTFGPIKVMFDLTNLDGYDKRIALDEFRFYRDNKDALRQVAVVSDSRTTALLTRMFDRFAGVEARHFPATQLEEARRWTFRKPLP